MLAASRALTWRIAGLRRSVSNMPRRLGYLASASWPQRNVRLEQCQVSRNVGRDDGVEIACLARLGALR